jgi:hypothetical protein
VQPLLGLVKSLVLSDRQISRADQPPVGLLRDDPAEVVDRLAALHMFGHVTRTLRCNTHLGKALSFQWFAKPANDLASYGAQERTRTSTPLRAPAPEAGASTNSATWAL